MNRSQLRAAWIEAGRRLGIRVTAPYEYADAAGAPAEAEAFVPDFGSRSGTLVITIEDQANSRHADGSQAFVARVSDCYSRFDESLFIATLNDWGWKNASSAPPSWYSGAPWS